MLLTISGHRYYRRLWSCSSIIILLYDNSVDQNFIASSIGNGGREIDRQIKLSACGAISYQHPRHASTIRATVGYTVIPMHTRIGNTHFIRRAKADNTGVPTIRAGGGIGSSAVTIANPNKIHDITYCNGQVVWGEEIVTNIYGMCGSTLRTYAHTRQEAIRATVWN